MSALKRRPIVWALIFWAAGSLAALYSGTVSGFIAASLACCGLACLIFFLIKRPFAFIYIAFFFLGALLTARSLAPRDPAADALADSGETLTMSGVVLDVSKTSTGKLAFTYKCTRVDGQKAGFVVSAVLIDGDTAEIGQSLVLSAKLAKPGRAANPGDFDDFLYYKARKVDYTAYPAILSKGGVSVSANSVLSFVRNKIEDVYDAIFPPEQAGLVKSIVLGDKSGLDDDTKELYRAAGVYHVLCVSGLHISIISGAIYLLLKRLKGQKLRGLLTLAVVAAYTVMTGASVPAVRALVMAAVVIAGRLLYRERDLPSSVAFACLCLLAYEPLYLLDAGFQISFTAVFGIAALARPLEREFGRRGLGKVKGAAGSSAAATLGMFPVTCWHFYTFQTYSILTNMI
ncbi:MAG: competence protein ComEC family protein, partial [Defluviitaleaceae bacterium]|nr:competence protein ComEC family protein [Defluviitaleaceae bacterium]